SVSQFDGYNGASPDTPLVEDAAGILYGTTRYGGRDGKGVIFQLSIPASGPQITSQPSGTTTHARSTVTQNMAVFGRPPLFYQWHKDGADLSDGPNVLGAHARNLNLMSVTSANAGSYSVTVTNAFGSVLSTQAVLQVMMSPPVFALQPTNQTL